MILCAKCSIPTKAIAVFVGNVGACPEHASTVLAELMEVRKSEAERMIREANVVDRTDEKGISDAP